jgi:hypothetical protein
MSIIPDLFYMISSSLSVCVTEKLTKTSKTELARNLLNLTFQRCILEFYCHSQCTKDIIQIFYVIKDQFVVIRIGKRKIPNSFTYLCFQGYVLHSVMEWIDLDSDPDP